MLEIWELITGRKQHKIGKDGGDFWPKRRPDKGCSATEDDEIIIAHSMKFRAFWDVAPCSHVKVDRRFRNAYCLHHQGDK
jgi:hypothetical protein